jgi:hypothetical protein
MLILQLNFVGSIPFVSYSILILNLFYTKLTAMAGTRTAAEGKPPEKNNYNQADEYLQVLVFLDIKK